MPSARDKILALAEEIGVSPTMHGGELRKIVMAKGIRVPNYVSWSASETHTWWRKIVEKEKYRDT